MTKLTSILTGINALVILAMTAIIFLSIHREGKKSDAMDAAPQAEHASGKEVKESKVASKKKPADETKIMDLDELTVNLSTPGSANPKFVRVSISLEIPTDGTEGEVTSQTAKIRDAIIELFNSKRPADLATTDGRNEMKDAIKNTINGFMGSGRVREVYFSKFVLPG